MPGLNIDLSVKYKQILKAFQAEIQAVAVIYEKNKHEPEILRNISPVAGRIGWVRQLYRRIETPMMVFSKISNILKVRYIRCLVLPSRTAVLRHVPSIYTRLHEFIGSKFYQKSQDRMKITYIRHDRNDKNNINTRNLCESVRRK